MRQVMEKEKGMGRTEGIFGQQNSIFERKYSEPIFQYRPYKSDLYKG